MLKDSTLPGNKESRKESSHFMEGESNLQMKKKGRKVGEKERPKNKIKSAFPNEASLFMCCWSEYNRRHLSFFDKERKGKTKKS